MLPLPLLFPYSIIVPFGVRSEANVTLDMREASSASWQGCSVAENVCTTGGGGLQPLGNIPSTVPFVAPTSVELWNRNTIDAYPVGRCS